MRQVFLLSILCLFVYFSEPTCDPLITDFSIDNCINMMTNLASYYYSVDSNTCLPSCKPYPADGVPSTGCPCAPAYVCVKRCSGQADARMTPCVTNDDCEKFIRSKCKDTCITDSNTCMAYYANTSEYRDNVFSALKFKPACQNDGFWKAKQCKGGVSGRCFCYSQLGKRLFGEARYMKSNDMTCSCSRKRSDLMDGGRNFVSLHCNSLGNFEPLQCDSGLCWCAEEKTGELTSPVVPEKAMNKLPCFEVSQVGAQYYRQCDSVLYAMREIQRFLNNHGVTYVNFGVKVCDGDGTYGYFNISDGLAYCLWRDGTKIGGWQSDSSQDIASINCNCARDFKMYNHQLTCTGNGNYRDYQSVIQNFENYFYCVDDDGFAKTDLTTERFDNCSYYY